MIKIEDINSVSDIESLNSKEIEAIVLSVGDNLFELSQDVMDPYEDDYFCFSNNQATIIGFFSKISTLLFDYLSSYKNGRSHLCFIYGRIMYEAFIKMKYLINKGETAQKEYRLCSYKDRLSFYRTYKDKNDGYFKVRNDKFLEDLSLDGFSLNDFPDKLSSLKSFGGKSFKQLMAEYDNEDYYSSLYGMQSDFIHSDWGELRQIYLKRTENNDFCAIYSVDKHYRMIVPIEGFVIEVLLCFHEWVKDVDNKLYEDLNNNRTHLLQLKKVYSVLGNFIMQTYQNNPSIYYNK